MDQNHVIKETSISLWIVGMTGHLFLPIFQWESQNLDQDTLVNRQARYLCDSSHLTR